MSDILSIAKTLILGGKPWQFEVEANYFVDQPDAFGPKCMIGLNVTPIVNNFVDSMIRGK